MAKGKKIFTTGDVAQICNVATRTVSKWFDSGQLKGYRIPGSKDRRIPVNELKRFMQAHNIPLTQLPTDKIRILVLSSKVATAKTLRNKLAKNPNYEVTTAQTNFQAGLLSEKFKPSITFVNLSTKEFDISEICTALKNEERLADMQIVSFGQKLSSNQKKQLSKKGLAASFDELTCEDILDIA